MNFSLPKLRFRRNRNPSSAAGASGIVHAGDDNMTAEASSECNVRGGDDNNENSSSVRSNADAVEASSSSSVPASSARAREPESDVQPPSSSTAVVVGVPAATDGRRNPNIPPVDDCCPICFNEFAVPCRAPCGHWYCGGCVLKYWNYSSALRPCSCPMCSLRITSLTPEPSLLRQQQEADLTGVLVEVHHYNRLYAGGRYAFFRRVARSPLVLRRVGRFMLDPDAFVFRNCLVRAIAILFGFLYSIIPFDFLHIGGEDAVYIFDCYAVILCSILSLVGLFLHYRRLQRARAEMPAIEL